MQIDKQNGFNNYYLLGLIFVAAIFLRILVFSGYVGGDDAAYSARAYAYSVSDFSTPYDHWGSRHGIVLPTAIAYNVFGVHDLSTVLAPFAFSLATVILAYMLGRRLFDTETGLLSALLICVFPMEVLFASQLFPYSFLSFWLTTSLLFFLRGVETEKLSFFYISGICLGCAYSCRITALFCCLFFTLHYLVYRERLLRYVNVAFGLLTVVLIEVFVN